MALVSNPYFSNSDVFGEPRRTAKGQPVRQYGQPAGGPVAGGQGVATQEYRQPHYAPVDPAALQSMYEAPSATTADTKRLTYDDVIVKTGGLLALLVIVGAATWQLAPGIWPIGMVVGLVLGLINAFKKNPSPALILLYTVAQGTFLGGISRVYETFYDGVVLQAVLATVCTFAVCLMLFKSGKVRVTGKFVRWLLIAMAGYFVFSLLNVVLVWTGVLSGWGMRGGTIGIIIGLIAVGLAAASLIVDFDSIKRGVETGAPARFAWAAAFGLMVTLIWLYLEFLRLLAIFSGRD
jgi:uncharacterized YccA/Bax inhibitor family protein